MQHIDPQVEPWMLVPFAIVLLAIALAPLIAGRAWEKNINKFIFVLLVSLPTAVFLTYEGFGHHLMHQIFYDYVPFITLLTALFVVTGGLHLHYNTTATPIVNTAVLFVGYGLASVVGTTGAAMLLIRPLLEMNRHRTHKTHTVMFFIAMVANCGGILSPLGDPPLFLLYLRGAPFGWFPTMIPEWAFIGTTLLLTYFLLDTYLYNHKDFMGVRPRGKDEEDEPLSISVGGVINVFFLSAIVFAVAFINPSAIPEMGAEDAPLWLQFLREIILVAIIILSLVATRRRVRRDNHFSWEPIIEVAVLFIGIFITMTPALVFLNDNAAALGISTPREFFYTAGILSSFLDNAPTAVAFHTVAEGLPIAEGTPIVAGVAEPLLRAIALGAVLFGAMTYIGNGPNFMVKAIAEESGVKMPSFFGYIFKFSIPVLLVVYVAMQFIFMR